MSIDDYLYGSGGVGGVGPPLLVLVCCGVVGVGPTLLVLVCCGVGGVSVDD